MKGSYRILAEEHHVNNDTWVSGLNNNDVIIGPSGAGKTRGYVIPNILQKNESMLVTDTKGSIGRQVTWEMVESGYQVYNIDFTGGAVTCGYNPFDYIRYDKANGTYSQQDIKTIASVLVPRENEKDPFWDYAARLYLESMIAYVLECLPKEEHHMISVLRLFQIMNTRMYLDLFEELSELRPNSYALGLYRMYENNRTAERMHESIRGILGEKLGIFTLSRVQTLLTCERRIDFREMGRKKTLVLLTVSDTDRSMDRLADLFYTQALHELCRSADKDYPDSRLEVPVRLILDDFAANAYIPDFDKITSVIRSREISVSIILQSLSQLESLYGTAKAKTILNNCDHCLYLGGQDTDTACYIGAKANKTTSTILNMPLEDAWLFERGRDPKQVRKYRLEEHRSDMDGKEKKELEKKKSREDPENEM
ncbi:MAG: type IV secretory system conjugative DNA transfer family protein [Lachnospiraceae bacterium]|nr:type IV secretory system conjugative DNA transfer family protein [Lachnospiraceae bacterium]